LLLTHVRCFGKIFKENKYILWIRNCSTYSEPMTSHALSGTVSTDAAAYAYLLEEQ